MLRCNELRLASSRKLPENNNAVNLSQNLQIFIEGSGRQSSPTKEHFHVLCNIRPRTGLFLFVASINLPVNCESQKICRNILVV